LLNVRHGGWTADHASIALQLAKTLFDAPVTLSALRG